MSGGHHSLNLGQISPVHERVKIQSINCCSNDLLFIDPGQLSADQLIFFKLKSPNKIKFSSIGLR